MAEQNLIHVTIRTTEDLMFEGDVDRVTSYNEMGRFDVYTMHANFISIIKQSVTLYHKHEIIKEVKLDQAVMKVKQNQVSIFLGIESLLLGDEEPIPQSKSSAIEK